MSALAKFFLLAVIFIVMGFLVPMIFAGQSSFIQLLIAALATAAIDVWVLDRRLTTSYKKANVTYKAI